jgi:hypothetical protein
VLLAGMPSSRQSGPRLEGGEGGGEEPKFAPAFLTDDGKD